MKNSVINTLLFFAPLLFVFLTSPSFAYASTTSTVTIFPNFAIDDSSYKVQSRYYDMSNPRLWGVTYGGMNIQDCPNGNMSEYIGSWGVWPTSDNEAYDENAYIEFDFPNNSVPENAIIDKVTLNGLNFTASIGLSPGLVPVEKYEIYNGSSFIDQPLPDPDIYSILCDSARPVSFDVTSILPTPDLVNNTKIRFLLADLTGSYNFVTGNDYLAIVVDYHLPETAPSVYAQDISNSVDNPFTINLTGTSSIGNPLTYSIVTNPSLGVLGAVSDSSVVYTPSGKIGDDSFIFKANDGTLDSATSTITLHLSAGTTTSFSIASDLATTTTGSTTTLTFTSYDKFGNIVTNDNTTNIFISSDIGEVGTSTLNLLSGIATTTAGSSASGTVLFTASSTNPLYSTSTSVMFFDPEIIDTSTTSATSTDTITGTSTNNVSNDASAPVVSSGGGGGGGGVGIYVPPVVLGDTNNDGHVDIIDFNTLMMHWGEDYPSADFNHDGIVDILDFNTLMTNWTN